jgi:hypothetical protein
MNKITLSDEQVDIVEHMELHNKCKIIVATGVGKTFTQAEVFAREIKRCNLRKRNSVNVIKAGRRILVDQLACEYAEYLLFNHGLKIGEHYEAVIVHTGESVNKTKSKKVSTFDETLIELDREDRRALLKEQLKFSDADVDIYPKTNSDRFAVLEMIKDRKLPMLIFTTYHSNEKVGKIINLIKEEVEIDMNDEAHFLTFGNEDRTTDKRDKRLEKGSKRMWNELFKPGDSIYTPVRQYFHTATESTTTGESYLRPGKTNEGIGMDNPERFGKDEHKKLITTRNAIDKRLILEPKAYRIKGNDDSLWNDELEDQNPDQFIESALDTMEAAPDCSRTALLVSINGVKQAAQLYGMTLIDVEKNIYDDPYVDSTPEWIEHMQEKYKGIQILSLFSDRRFIRHNGKQINKKKFMQLLKEYGNSDCRFLLIHHDTLAEGVDVTGLHGLLFLRLVNIPKTIQTVGRVLRVDKDDRSKLTDNYKLQLKNIPDELWASRTKQVGHVFWPRCKEEKSDRVYTDRYIKVYREGIPLEGTVKSSAEKINGNGPGIDGPIVVGPDGPESLGEDDLGLTTQQVEAENHQPLADIHAYARDFKYVRDPDNWKQEQYLVGKRFKYKDIWIVVDDVDQYRDEETGNTWKNLNKAITKATGLKYGKESSLSAWVVMRDENGRSPKDVAKQLHAKGTPV